MNTHPFPPRRMPPPRRLQWGRMGRIVVAALAVSAAGFVGIANFEGYRGAAYRDSVGVPTIGYGATAGVKLGQTTSPERALVRLLADVNSHSEGIKRCISVPLYQHEFDAYSTLAYNIGVGAFCGSTLAKKLNAGDYPGACAEILRWDRAGGKVLRGLTVRRQAENRTCTGAGDE